jgi:hypothetical protein
VALDAHHLGAEPVDAIAQQVDDLLLEAPAVLSMLGAPTVSDTSATGRDIMGSPPCE